MLNELLIIVKYSKREYTMNKNIKILAILWLIGQKVCVKTLITLDIY